MILKIPNLIIPERLKQQGHTKGPIHIAMRAVCPQPETVVFPCS
jgi:hypothetical protein